tara:strand:- start:17017 stop:17682 length:666 start_codon:yes stop_codon:yes gene_type:complete
LNFSQELIGLARLGTQTTEYYEVSLNERFQQAYNTQQQCPLFILDCDFGKINEHLPEQFDALLPLLTTVFENFTQADVGSIIIPNITLHSAIDKLSLAPEIQAKIIHPLHTGIQFLKSQDIKQITLAGTRHTMQSEQLSSYFEKAGIRVLRPVAEHIKALDKIRISVYEAGFSEILLNKMQDILKAYANVVLACTELSVLNREDNYYDLTKIQIEQAIARG